MDVGIQSWAIMSNLHYNSQKESSSGEYGFGMHMQLDKQGSGHWTFVLKGNFELWMLNLLHPKSESKAEPQVGLEVQCALETWNKAQKRVQRWYESELWSAVSARQEIGAADTHVTARAAGHVIAPRLPPKVWAAVVESF